MPTMTRMHRHSSSSAVVEESRGRRRGVGVPGAGEANKENFGVHFMSSPFGNASLIALQDLSNVHGKSPQRRSFSEGSGPRQATPQLAALRCLPRTTGGGGGAVGGAVGGLEDSQLSSSRMGDTTLDRMLDAIIESARKEVRCAKPLGTAGGATAPSTILADNGEWSETSVHEMEVRTPTHLKRQRVVRRKNPHKTHQATTQTQSHQTKKMEQLQLVPSTKRCLSFSSSSASSDLDEDEQQVAKRSSLASSSSSSSATPPSHSTTSNSSNSNSNSGADLEASQRGSIDVSISYDAKEQQLNVHVIRCRDLQRSHGSGNGSINAYVKVALSGGPHHQPQPGCGAHSSGGSMNSGYQRTAVHRHSGRPYFDQRFSFPISSGEETNGQHLQLAVWHRDRHLKRSEFLGCSSFPLTELVHPEAGITAGSYKLQAQACPPPNHRQSQPKANAGKDRKQEVEEEPEAEANRDQDHQEYFPAEMAAATTVTPQKPVATGSGSGSISAAMPLNDEVISISIDSMGKEDPLLPQQPQQPMKLSKKALHQRDADENLFLRFLELDPPADGNANSTTQPPTTGSQSSASKANESNANHLNGSTGRRQSTMPPSGGSSGGGGGGGGATRQQPGRTPFTMTKRLTRTEERGFGFSIVWTHPPRVEKIEAGLSADRCGILPGDYVIFVDKHNVVTMPEADVLNLIRSQGSSLTLEIFRRSGAGATTITTDLGHQNNANMSASRLGMGVGMGVGVAVGLGSEEHTLATTTTATTTVMSLQRTQSSRMQPVGNSLSRPATACSGTTSSIEAAKRRLHLPQVTFSKESIVPITDNRRRFLLQLISREQNFTAALHFGVDRFVQPLVERKDLISPNDHRTLFQNIDELLRIAEDILEQLCSSDQQDQEPHMNFASRVYLSKTTAICAAYKKYCNGIKRADCVLVNKSRQTGSEFIAFITEPAVPRKRPDLTMFIHRPLQHFREILKLMQLLAGNCHVDTEEHKNFSTVINELQAAYREITVSSGLMEPLGEGRPLLTLQDLESRMVFTKCKPFTLAVQGRQWIFGGDLSRVEGRSVKPYWTLLFSDIIVFAKVSRDRVLFITEEPIPIANVVDSCFHMRKKTTEFRLTVDPNGRLAESPTGYCAPDLTRTPKRGARRKSLILRAPSLELKAVWQNLLQRQIFLVNAALGSTPLSSPLDSPDVLNTLVPLSDIGLTTASMGSMKLPSLDSIHLKQQQKQQRNNNAHANAHSAGGVATERSADRSHGHSHGVHGGHVEQIELLIDEKCRILNKTGTPKSSALHLANWMKGQLDKQQQQARLAAIARSQENVSAEDEQLIFNSDSEQDERITYWTRQQLEKRTKELNLAKENGGLSAKPNFGGKRLSGVEELSMSATSDIYSTSEAEGVTSVISQSHSTTSDSQITVRSSPIVLDKLAVCRHCHKNCQQSGPGGARPGGGGGVNNSSSAPVLLCNSLKVQHSQSSPNRCCKLNNGIAGAAELVSPRGGNRTGTGTGTGSVTSMSSSTITGELSSKVVASSSRRETGDTESDVAQLITDEISQSQSEATDDSVGAMPNSSSSAGEGTIPPASSGVSKVRHLDPPVTVTASPMPNGHCSAGGGSPKPLPPPRRTRIVAQMCQEPLRPKANQQVKAIVTITETARIMRSSPTKGSGSGSGSVSGSVGAGGSPAKFAACNCRCTPEDFTHAQLSPDKMEHQTCKLLESPKQTATTLQQKQDDEQLSLMLIGLAQFAPAAKLCGQERIVKEESGTPTIAVVPPTPDSVLTKTSTHVWDNSGCSSNGGGTSTTSTATTTTKQPRQAIIENIPEDSCDESPLDEEPPYRPMSSALRRFGTMSSLEKLPSDDRMDEADELEDDLEPYTPNGHDADSPQNEEDDEDAGSDRALVQNVNDLGASTSSGVMVNGEVLASGAWTNRAGAYVSDKMSFFEESRAFIDKYLGRWNAGDSQQQQQGNASETDEQMDECTSGATSGEEVWGTPTSGGDNDDQDMQLINSENTHSSPTKSSTSLNDDDDTELMMDELLMAPPMTASTIRGLLPRFYRRRLEPLFEEETESDEEKTQQDSDDVKKGEATTNGHYLEDSAGSSSDSEAAPPVPPPAPRPVVPDREEDPSAEDLQEEDDPDVAVTEDQEDTHSSVERLHPNLATSAMGPRPLLTTRLLPTTAIDPQPPAPVMVASSCEYLLDQRPSSGSGREFAAGSSSSTTTPSSRPTPPSPAKPAVILMPMPTEMMMTTMTTTTPNRAPSSITTITSSASGTTNSGGRASGRPPRFVPPPPPPRRLLLTQTDLSAAQGKTEPPQRKSGATADSGSSAVVGGAASASDPIATGSRTTPSTPSTSSSAAAVGVGVLPKRPSSTIIETCLLGAPRPVSATSSATVSRTAKPIRPSPSTTHQQPSQPRGQSSPAAVAPPPPAAPPPDAPAAPALHAGCGLSPRLEMRLALNHDILGDEDLICYEPGPDLTTILGHDLSTFHRLTGRDLLSRSATNRVQPKEAVISYSQQRNSKMDTPTVNRRPRPLSAGALSGTTTSTNNNHSRSSSSHGSSPLAGGLTRAAAEQVGQLQHQVVVVQPGGGSAGRVVGGNGNAGDNNTACSSNRGGSKLGDLEILARREKIYSMSQSRSGCRVRETTSTSTMSTTTTTTTSTTTLVAMATEMRSGMDSGRRDSSWPKRAAAAASLTRTRSTTSMDGAGAISTTTTTTMTEEAFLETEVGRSKRLINFIKRRNSEITASSTSSTPNFSDGAFGEQPHPSHSQSSLLLQKLSPGQTQAQDSVEMAQMSPRKDNDKPSLNRRLWKQITKRRRTNSVSQIVAG
ncbi:LOW QUALITY PROTEIN: serine-rich adhesin for platelets [Drosophila rhopaloa]|uniref:Serine-rich adhesin for platelets n=1 Tax=Drosophila rhopaloa TaxID=1041015 RepID=A0ABM5HM68_DRORH|nr:LOW QUALITY PROTEIN: serine-rich adhesin for platelets [Drosophila rhopaloa]